MPEVFLSIVSHGHGSTLWSALRAFSDSLPAYQRQLLVIITINVPEPDLETRLESADWPFRLKLLKNQLPVGFGANHNRAYAHAMSISRVRWFIVMNPDIFWPPIDQNFWEELLRDTLPRDTGLLCPQQLDISGAPQDFARKLLTPWGLALRVLRRLAGLSPSGVAASVEEADWVNGACMVWRGQAFEALGGFDERFFMYCEDTDLCLRARLAGWRMQSAGISVIHDARRQTVRSWRHLKWHLVSLARLWTSGVFWRYVLRKPSSGSANATL